MSNATYEGIEELYEYIAEETAYYDWLDVSLESVGDGRVVVSVPFGERTNSPRVAPDSLHGGVIATMVDAAAMGAIIARKREFVQLVTTDLDVTYHDATAEDAVVEGRVVGGEGTLMTARVDVYPQSAWEADGEPTATGTATARILRGG